MISARRWWRGAGRPIFAVNTPEAELAPVLDSNFMRPVIPSTCYALWFDTPRKTRLNRPVPK
jgi:hypothetical protein